MGQALGEGPLQMQKRLYNKFSSSQSYFYTNKINEIIKEKRTNVNIFYEDIEYMLDLQENLKRWYQAKQFDSKMFTFKEYYFYHEDCPRIFIKGIEEPYARWQDKKRDLVYKKLKILYKESYQSEDSHMDDQKSQNYVATTHFLLEISDYNPFSKKYYLRVEARKEKERKIKEQEKKNQSKRDIESLNHDLSAMLQDMSTLSEISTIANSPLQEKERPKLKIRTYIKDKSEDKSKSTNLSNSNSIITFNFKKNKGSLEKIKNTKDPKKVVSRQISREKEAIPEAGRISPKFNSSPGEAQFLKSKSIFSVSSFGALHRNTDLQSTMSKKDNLKINFQTKKLTIDDHSKKYSTEKKKDSVPKNVVIKTKSTSKLEPRASMEKLRSRQGSLGRLPKAEEFSDKKISSNIHQFETRMRSLKSQFVGGTKKLQLNTRPNLQIDKGKQLLQLRRW